ncbi:hypothetical protein [Polynucleobacter sp. UK-Kesae-W10]|uniref:hypothetical protein n=1 Tax=Polynucleobacter sp. UK-Kesae-W10 TaxID=1819738 RepID=UPI001C0DB6F9|nr:hypothetical protein [Polynucleobacter sp. UK-Kesae-W10]MBU3577501.1 hypothetical protein [Polynucleobacter sp. UK-Kesae-W10]
MKDFVFKVLVLAATIFVAIPLMVLWQGWAASTLWLWFAVPLGMPEISIVTAAGLALFLSALKLNKANKSCGSSSQVDSIAASIIIPPVVVLVGWILKTFA